MALPPNLKLPSIATWLCVVAFGAAALVPSSALASFPPAGTDVLTVTGSVGVTSTLGTETIPLTGTATIVRQSTHLEGSAEVQSMELTALDLDGVSLIGAISINESPTAVSPGELRALQPSPQSYPASSYFDVYMQAVAPANPNPTITLYNTTPLHMVPTFGTTEVPLNSWPPYSKTFLADTTPCVPLLPTLPMNVCITALSITISAPTVGGVAELAPPQQPASRNHIDRSPAITPAEGVIVGVTALVFVMFLSGAVWWVRRNFLR